MLEMWSIGFRTPGFPCIAKRISEKFEAGIPLFSAEYKGRAFTVRPFDRTVAIHDCSLEELARETVSQGELPWAGLLDVPHDEDLGEFIKKAIDLWYD